YAQAKKMVNDFELSVETKLDYQISYKEIHADLPSDPTSTYQKEWIDWSVFLDKNYI
ncbi:MAG TPA: hypothetical protein DCQ66_02305, partial [Gammaproteobacteria bacterium]|nr:hypothetical protein [Gammaproteobacteria bacterium]